MADLAEGTTLQREIGPDHHETCPGEGRTRPAGARLLPAAVGPSVEAVARANAVRVNVAARRP